MRLAVLLLAATAAAADPAPLERARAFRQAWARGEYTEMHAALTTPVQELWKDFEEFQRWWPTEPGKVLSETVKTEGDRTVYRAELMDREAIRALTLGFDPFGRVAALTLSADGVKTPYPSAHEGRQTPVKLRFPFPPADGAWTVYGEHHRPLRSQRFAYDLVRKVGDSTFRGDPKANEAYFAWGRPVYAPADAVVLFTRDGEPDEAPSPAPKAVGPGNHVILKVNDAFYLLLGHLRRDSVAVKDGDEVFSGQALGEVGDSGRSTEPHLHIEAFDRYPRERADSWPIWFSDVLHNGKPATRALASYGDTLEAMK